MDEILESLGLVVIMIYGVSGITDVNLREGLNSGSGVFDKSRTNMDEGEYVNYCRIGDPRQIKHIIDEGRKVVIQPAERIGIDMVIEDFGIVLHSSDFEPLLHAMSYPLYYQETDQKKYGPLRAMLMVFKIGEHRVDGVKYVSDRPILRRDDEITRDYLCSDTDFEDASGYHLELGIVKVQKVLEIIEDEKGRPALSGGAQKPFRLHDMSKEFGL